VADYLGTASEDDHLPHAVVVPTRHLDSLAEECTNSVSDWAMCNAEHDALDPEYSILKQRLARRIRHDGLTDVDIAKMDLVGITKVGNPATMFLKCPSHAYLHCIHGLAHVR